LVLQRFGYLTLYRLLRLRFILLDAAVRSEILRGSEYEDGRLLGWQKFIKVPQVTITLMMESASTSETLVNFYQITRSYNPEDSRFQ
jgi:hypothetical protein